MEPKPLTKPTYTVKVCHHLHGSSVDRNIFEPGSGARRPTYVELHGPAEISRVGVARVLRVRSTRDDPEGPCSIRPDVEVEPGGFYGRNIGKRRRRPLCAVFGVTPDVSSC